YRLLAARSTQAALGAPKGCPPLRVCGPWLLALLGGGPAVAAALGASSGHVVDDGRRIELRDRTLGDHPPQMQDHDPVGNREHIVEVVGDDEHRDSLRRQ